MNSKGYAWDRDVRAAGPQRPAASPRADRRVWPRIRQSLGGLSLFALALPALAQPAPTGVGSQFELVFWQSVAASEDVDQYAAYLERYPQGTFAALARAKIERLRGPAPTPGPGVAPMAATQAPRPAPVSAIPAVTLPPPAPAVPSAAPTAAAVTVPAPLPMPTAIAVPAPAPVPAALSAPAASVGAPPATMATTSPAATTAPAAPAATSPAAPSLSEQLAALARSQERPATTASASNLPAPPALPEPPRIDLPPRFCSAVERNAFYDEAFQPSKVAADENNRRAIAHLRALQTLYDSLGQQGDAEGQNAVAAASRAYQPVAAEAYRVSSDYERRFEQLMAVPIAACPPPVAGKAG